MFEFDFSELIAFGDNLVTEFDPAMRDAARKIATVVYRRLKQRTPKKTGKLSRGWDTAGNMAFRVTTTARGQYMVELTNNVEYAMSVNYGHHSYNQFGGPYVVKRRTVPYYRGGRQATFVYGHFFVEKAILELEESKAIKQIMNRCLKTWFQGCIP